jgi:hypothetical protein
MAIFLKANWENIIMANYEIDLFCQKVSNLIYSAEKLTSVW